MNLTTTPTYYKQAAYKCVDLAGRINAFPFDFSGV